MAQATQACLHDTAHSALWQGIVGVEEGVAELDEVVAAIIGSSQTQSARNGFTAEKKEARRVMLEAGFLVCCGLTALAAATNNPQLAAQSAFSRSSLGAGRERDVVNRCQALADLGTANAAALAAKYNVSAADLATLTTAIADFTATQPKPRQGRSISAAATKRLEALFVQLDEALLNRLDPLTAKFKTTNPAFHSAYRTARVIVDNAASREAKAAVVTPIPTALPKAA